MGNDNLEQEILTLAKHEIFDPSFFFSAIQYHMIKILGPQNDFVKIFVLALVFQFFRKNESSAYFYNFYSYA